MTGKSAASGQPGPCLHAFQVPDLRSPWGRAEAQDPERWTGGCPWGSETTPFYPWDSRGPSWGSPAS